MIENTVIDRYAGFVGSDMLMPSITPRMHTAVDNDDITDLHFADLLFGDRRLQNNFFTGQRKTFTGCKLPNFIFIAVHPRCDGTGRSVNADTKTAERPAIVSNRDEETCGQTVIHTDLHAETGYFTAEPHRTDTELIGFFDAILFQLCKNRIGIDIVKTAEELIFGKRITRSSVTADADPQESDRASLTLSLPDSMKDTFLDTFEIAPCFAEMVERRWKRVLNILILTPPAFEDKFYFNIIFFPLLPIDNGYAGTEIIAAIFTGKRIDRVGAEFPAFGSFFDRPQTDGNN